MIALPPTGIGCTPHKRVRLRIGCFVALCGALGLVQSYAGPPVSQLPLGTHVIFGYNDLGMHCMGSDFSEIMVLPPFNTLRAQVVRRGDGPEIVTSGLTLKYVIPQNTQSAGKSNFWRYPQALFGPAPSPNIGLAGFGLAGTMVAATNDWAATGIPITPTDDMGRENPYSLATITALQGSTVVGRTQAVVPVSTEMSCILCHNTPGVSTATDILQRHDDLHGTSLLQERPVLCARCHGSNALGLPGDPNLPNLSRAMHGAHAPRMGPVQYLSEVCYACHPGIRTKCQRDVHYANGIGCTDCHGNMEAVADPNRQPWATEPRCDNCHHMAGHEYEQPGTLFRNSIGHSGIRCSACHGSPHAITPTVTAIDNQQAIMLQGHAGVINTCSVCHTVPPSEPFFHKVTN